jgi:hypothetical protein
MTRLRRRIVLAGLAGFSVCLFTFAASALTPEEKGVLTAIRSSVFGGSRLAAAFEQTTISGAEPPIFPLEVENRGVLVWRVHEEDADRFAAEIGLPPAFSLAKTTPLTTRGSQVFAARVTAFLEKLGLGGLVPKHYYVIADIGVTRRAETGAKVEFKTFVQFPGDNTPRLYRFASFKAAPGVDLLELSSGTPAALTVSADSRSWSGELVSEQGGLLWRVPLASKRRVTDGLRFSESFLNAGERVFGPLGSAARYYYDGSSVSGGFLRTVESKAFVENTFSWSKYISSPVSTLVLDPVTEYLVQPITSAVQVTTAGPGQCGAPAANSSALFSNLVGCVLAGLEPELVFGQLFQNAGTIPPQELPTLYYAVLDLYQGLSILQGTERPKLFFSLVEDPRIVFINFEIPPSKVAEFEHAFLPENFKLARMRFYPEQRRPLYAVSLNVYQSVGQNLSGLRAEWSTYVINPAEDDPKPRFSVLEAQTNIGGFDAVGALERYTPDLDLSSPEALLQLIEPPSDLFEYTADETAGIRLRVLDVAEEIEVDVSIATPAPGTILHTVPTTNWVEANDFVYWGEVADVLKYDSKVMFADLLVFDAQPGDIIHDTTFAGFVDPDPLPIIIWNGPQDIALEPWGNLEGIVPTD